MKTNDVGIALIKKFELFSPIIYLCPAKIPTIYWGHVVRSGEVFDGTMEQGEEILKKDLYYSECSVSRLIKVPLTSNSFAALVSFTFNVGGGALQASTLRIKLNREEYLEAALQFDRWVMAGGVRLRGLVVRRAAERILFLS